MYVQDRKRLKIVSSIKHVHVSSRLFHSNNKRQYSIPIASTQNKWQARLISNVTSAQAGKVTRVLVCVKLRMTPNWKLKEASANITFLISRIIMLVHFEIGTGIVW